MSPDRVKAANKLKRAMNKLDGVWHQWEQLLIERGARRGIKIRPLADSAGYRIEHVDGDAKEVKSIEAVESHLGEVGA